MLPERLALAVDPSYALADGTSSVRVTYSEDSQQELHGYSVAVMADTILPLTPLSFLSERSVAERLQLLNAQRITTMVMRFSRGVLAELNTHRVFSRNSASSRARSIKVVIGEAMEDPYVPLFTKNQKGMSGPLVSPEIQAAARIQWLKTRDSVVAGVLTMLLGSTVTPADLEDGGWRALTDDYYQRVYIEEQDISGSLNLHKQNVNRLLEPYMWHEAVITSTEWVNFLQLRDHNEADPAIHALAKLVGEALRISKPAVRSLHAPFAGELVREFENLNPLEDPLVVLRKGFEAANYSAGAAAQVSYRPVGDGGTGADPSKLANRLLAMAHLSPFEHAAFSTLWLRSLGVEGELPSNLSAHWTQHRALIRYLEEATGSTGLAAVVEALG